MGMGEDNRLYFLINNVSYKEPLVPTLLTVLSAPPEYVTEALIYGNSTNSYVLRPNKTIQIVINNMDMEEHPCTCQSFISRNTDCISSPTWACLPSSLSRSWYARRVYEYSYGVSDRCEPFTTGYCNCAQRRFRGTEIPNRESRCLVGKSPRSASNF